MPIRAILFDKDGTLVDIQLTLGPATCDVLRRLGGSEAMFARLAELTRLDGCSAAASAGVPDHQRGDGRLRPDLGAGARPQLHARVRARDRPAVSRNRAGASSPHR